MEEIQGGMINFVGDIGGGGQGFLVGAGRKIRIFNADGDHLDFDLVPAKAHAYGFREGKQYKACGNRVAYIKSDGGGVPIAFIGRDNAFHLGAVSAVGIIPDNLPIRHEMSPQ